MSSLNNGLVPVVLTTLIILLFIVMISLIDRLLRHEAVDTYKESLRNFRVLRVFRINFINTSIFSLTISLVRFNILFYLLIKTIGNMLFGSDLQLFNLNYVVSFVVICEFLFFLKTKKKNEINELSSLLLVIVTTLSLISLYKLSSNLVVERNVFWLSDKSFLNNWSILELPVLIVPIFYILVSLYTRIIKSSVALRYNTIDRLFDYLNNNLIYIYIVCFFLRSMFGGLFDIKLAGLENDVLGSSVISILIKFGVITILTRLLIRFLPSVIDIRKKNLIPLLIILIGNIGLIHIIKGELW